MSTRRRKPSHQRTKRNPNLIPKLKWREIKNPFPPIEILSEDQIEDIHLASLRVLSDSGIKFLSQKARHLFREIGADVDDNSCMVRFDPEFILETIKLAPSNFRIRARNPNRSIELGGAKVNFATVGGPSFVSDIDRGRRSGTIQDLKDFMKLTHQLEIFHSAGASPFEPLDLHAETRHLDKYLAAIVHHDKIWMGSMLGAFRARDALEMLAIVHGLNWEQMPDKPLTMGNININSPRQVDESMSDALIEFAKVKQPVLVTPFTLLGAMAPTTMAGALVQQNAEALSCIALTQVVTPGTPVVYGSFSSNVDMKTGAPAFGTPEYVRTTLASGQLARRYALPLRTSGANASNAPDAQSAYETCMSNWAAIMGHTNFLLHSGGWLEGGLVASFEKLIIDAEILQILAESLQPIVVNDDTLAVNAIADVSPGGHFFGSPHTMQRYESAFYTPLLSDWRNFETWQNDGGQHSYQRANKIWKTLLKEYEPPPIDPAVVEELDHYITVRKKEILNGNQDAVLRNRHTA